MTKQIGDKIFVRKYAGFPNKWGVIADSEGNRECMEDPEFYSCMICDNPECFEWCDVQFEDGTYAYHVSECLMEKGDKYASKCKNKR